MAIVIGPVWQLRLRVWIRRKKRLQMVRFWQGGCPWTLLLILNFPNKNEYFADEYVAETASESRAFSKSKNRSERLTQTIATA